LIASLRDLHSLRAIAASRRIVRAAGGRYCRTELTSITSGTGEFGNSTPVSPGQSYFVAGRPTSIDRTSPSVHICVYLCFNSF
jgi:hypothetical protein